MSSTCSSRGTLDLSTRSCTCPCTHSGRACEESLLPSCTHLGHTMRPFFWIFKITRNRWMSGSPPSVAAMGPLPCSCVDKLLRATEPFRSKWTLLPGSVLCAARVDNKSEPSLSDLVRVGSEGVTWVTRAVGGGERRRQHVVSDPEADRLFGARLLSARECMNSCQFGW